jgi:putative transposase
MAKEKSPLDESLAKLLKGKSPKEILGQDGLLDQLTKRLVERALEGELTAHLGTRSTPPRVVTAGTPEMVTSRSE